MSVERSLRTGIQNSPDQERHKTATDIIFVWNTFQDQHMYCTKNSSLRLAPVACGMPSVVEYPDQIRSRTVCFPDSGFFVGKGTIFRILYCLQDPGLLAGSGIFWRIFDFLPDWTFFKSNICQTFHHTIWFKKNINFFLLNLIEIVRE